VAEFLAAEFGAEVYGAWGGREGAESGAAKDVRGALDRFKEAFDLHALAELPTSAYFGLWPAPISQSRFQILRKPVLPELGATRPLSLGDLSDGC
jgi:hypothetical protein